MRTRVLIHVHRRYPEELQQRILSVMAPGRTRTEEVCRLNSEVGMAFAGVAATVCRKLGKKRVDMVGSHGQTVCHLPPGTSAAKRSACGSLQIGDPAIIAARIGAPVVANFRQADMAVGGQGAPLVPWTDYVLFRDVKRNRVIQNIGGIANLTWLPAGGGPDDVRAFDVGPGNMVIDGLVSHFSRNEERFDRGGRRAARGKPDARLEEAMSDDEYLLRPPPKSCGREQFGETWIRGLLRRHGRRMVRPDDWVSSATHAAAMDMAFSYDLHLKPAGRRKLGIDEIILCGGGARNKTLVRWLRLYVGVFFENVRFCTTDDFGIPLQAKESVSFAMLAAACADRVPANLPRVTGAKRRVVLGQICDVGV